VKHHERHAESGPRSRPWPPVDFVESLVSLEYVQYSRNLTARQSSPVAGGRLPPAHPGMEVEQQPASCAPAPSLLVSLSPPPLVSLSPLPLVSLSPLPLVSLSPLPLVSLSPPPLVSLSPLPLVTLSSSAPAPTTPAPQRHPVSATSPVSPGSPRTTAPPPPNPHPPPPASPVGGARWPRRRGRPVAA